MPHAQALLELVHANWTTQAICVAAELRLADLLLDGPKSSADLAAMTGSHEPSLHRLLRALTTIDICREVAPGRFEVTPTGALLADGAPGSLRHWVLWWGRHLWPVWGNLAYSVKTGASARSLLTGQPGFKHLEDPATADVFNRAMAELTAFATAGIVQAYDFSRFGAIVDVGGGRGQLLASILKANSFPRGVLFDLPHAMESAGQFLRDAGLEARTECIAGDFFESIPGGADLYILKSILHDWNDDRAGRILANCRRAMSPSARLLIVERIMPDRLEATPEHRSLVRTDLSMLVALAASERSEADFRALLDAAGFEVVRIVPAGAMCLLEANPREAVP